MEIITFVKELVQKAVEHAVSYRLGQTCLRYVDKVLWTVEKSARWAVPPPLDQDERHQPDLLRPLPWVFFLVLLIALRVTRESISIINLALGKPPFRSADMVSYIQSKRRYLRTLKYQGSRVMRARSGPRGGRGARGARGSWRSGLHALFQLAMCFRAPRCANNNSTLSSTDEVVVIKRKRSRVSNVVDPSESSMERLIDRMMVDLDADSDESSSYTLTNAASTKSDRSDYTESDQEFRDTQTDIQTDTQSLITSTPERFSDYKDDSNHVGTILNFIQSERNGQPNYKIVYGGSLHSSPAQERIQEGELIY